jgi:hypothetical protein
MIHSQIKALGEEHLDTLRSISSLALANGRRGRWKEAEELELSNRIELKGA